MSNLSSRDAVLRELTTTMDQLLEAINGGVQYRMEVKKEVQKDCYSQGEQKEKRLEAFHQARFQNINREFLARYNTRDTDAMMETIRTLEETNKNRRKTSQDGEKRRQVLEHILVYLVLMLIEQSDRRHELHQELLAKYNNRSPHISMEVIRKLEEDNDVKRKASQGQTNRAKESPPVSQIMGMMLERNRKRQNVHQELMTKVEERKNKFYARKILHQELIMKILQKELLGIRRRIFQMEIMMKLLQKKLMGIRRCVLQMEMMRKVKGKQQEKKLVKQMMEETLSGQSEKQEVDETFLPRKLFVYGISTFK